MDPSEAAGHTRYAALAARMGMPLLRQRILRQAGLWARESHQGDGIFLLQRWLPLDDIIILGLRVLGLTKRTRREFLDVRIEHNQIVLPGLPPEFEGFRLLQLSDLHCDLDKELTDVIVRKIAEAEFDFAVLTGDFHNRIGEDTRHSLAEMAKILESLEGRCVGILGNHDFIEQVAFYESHGMPVLLNESFPLERGGARIYICGVDDPHFFKTDDLAAARRDVPSGAVSILLSHSPENYREAERLGYDVMLSGHLHGGQLCLPGGYALIRNADVPRSLARGSFRHGRMVGYTSRGTGGCGVAARWNCPPEITVHHLTAKPIGN